jgi:hypothetical protein
MTLSSALMIQMKTMIRAIRIEAQVIDSFESDFQL